ncbi:hypothetical protein VTN00DRAFT_2664 [Thermoascus crustaceus]|uniref:uncharacterized protein n=1 Tax=Thermoascus crustaceus TaxID=5088 RepID=UPI003743F1F5
MAATTTTRRNRGLEVEICYASPSVTAVGTALHFKPPVAPSASDGRKRKTGGSSDDSGEPLSDDLINEDLRTGCPYLCAIPTRSLRFPKNHPFVAHLHGDASNLLRNIGTILQSYQVDYQSVDLCGRQSKFDPEPYPIPTVLVLARKHNLDQKWLEASRMIRPLLLVLSTDAIYPVWNEVCDPILSKLLATSSSDSLEELNSELEAVFPKGKLYEVGDSRPLRINLFQKGAQAGVSLGIHNSNVSASTFGGWIELRHPQSGKWSQFGITCFHCIDPGSKAVSSTDLPQLQERYQNGISPNNGNAARMLQLDQPSLKVLESELRNTNREIESISTDKSFVATKAALKAGEYVDRYEKQAYKQDKRTLENYLSQKSHIQSFRSAGDSYLGHVFAASGYKDEKITTIGAYGTPPPYFSFPPDMKLHNWRIRDLENVGAVYKAGRSTVYTKGTYSGLESAHVATVIKDGKEVIKVTKEHCITGDNGKYFSLPEIPVLLCSTEEVEYSVCCLPGATTPNFIFHARHRLVCRYQEGDLRD